MAMFMFKTPDLIWVAEGDDEVRARAELAETIRREWTSGDAARERIEELSKARAERVPHALRLIRTFPLSDLGVY